MKTNLESLKEFVSGISKSHPDKVSAILSVVEKHYEANRKMVDDVMKLNGPKGGFSILSTNVPEFKSELLALR